MRWIVPFLITTKLFAQSTVGSSDVFDRVSYRLPDSTYYTLPPYEHWDRQPWRDSVYRYPFFQEGRFEFANGFSPSTRLKVNYNIFLETVDFLVDNEIAELKKFPELKVVWIGDQKFIYLPAFGYLEIVLDGKLSLARKTVMATVLEFSDGFRLRIPTIEDQRTTVSKSIRHYWPIDYYYVVDPYQHVHRPGPLLFPGLVPEAKQKIRDFATLNDINYKDKEDLVRLVSFCNEIYLEPAVLLNSSQMRDSLYMFNDFNDATLTYADGTKEEVNVNYNLETGWFDTINKQRDTVALSTIARLYFANVDVGTTLIYHPAQGLIEILMPGKVALGLKKRLVVDHIEYDYFLIKDNRLLLPTVKVLHSLFPKHKEELDWYVNAHNVNFRSGKDLRNLLNYCSRF